MLRDNVTFSSSGVIAAFGPVLGERVMLGMDEPVHGRLRSLVSKAFSQKALARWEDELVGRDRQRAHRQVRGRRQGRSGEGVHVRLSEPDHRGSVGAAGGGLPAIPALVHLATELDHEPGARTGGVGRALRSTSHRSSRPAAAQPKDDMISLLAEAEIDGEKLTDEEIFSFLRLLLPAGVETTYRSLGNLLFAIALGHIRSWTRCGPTGRCCRRPSRKQCAGTRHC